MKFFTFIVLFLVVTYSKSSAQSPVVDTHPTAIIYAIDYSSNQETEVTSGDGILFKDALIELVSNTNTSKRQLTKIVPGKKSFIITQMDPQTNGYAFQLVLQSKFLGQIIPIYTFLYSVDQNSLSFFNQTEQTWMPEMIQGYNLNNLNNSLAYSKFNSPGPEPDQSGQPAVDADADTSTPVDADVSATTAPPDMPDYQQPECPEDGYLWQPGYWAYSQETNGYYWVPGVWVAPPSVGVLWTPPYWGFDGGSYVFHTGYWGNTIGFYGGINYGYGYSGVGYGGGEWHEGHFRYNTAVVRVNERVIHNTYVDRSVYRDRGLNHSSFNGRGGYMARPNPHEMAAMHEHHVMATPEQNRNQRIARADRSQFASANGGKPGSLAGARVPERAPAGANRMNANPGSNGGGRPGMSGTNGSRPGIGGSRPGMTGGSGPRPSIPGAPGAPGAKSGGFGGKQKMPNTKVPKVEKSKSSKKS